MATVSTSTLSEALKRVYTSWLSNALNNEWLPLKRLKRTGKTVEINGSALHFAVHYARNGSVRAGSETGTLPTAGTAGVQSTYENISHQYGTVEWADAYMRKANNNKGAFARETDFHMKDLRDGMMASVARQVMGTGDGIISYIHTAVNTASPTLIVDDASLFENGMRIKICQGSDIDTTRHTVNDYLVVTGVDLDLNYIYTSGGTIASSAADDAIIFQGAQSGGTSYETVGLQQVCDDSETLHNLAPGTYRWWAAQVVANGDGANANLDLAKIHKAIHSVIIRGKYPTVMYMSFGVKRALIKLLQANQRYVDEITLDGGLKVEAFTSDRGPIPIITDRWAPRNTILFVCEPDMGWSNLGGDVGWLDKDGSILHLSATKPTYYSVSCWYPQLLCFRRDVQAKLTFISED